MIPLSTNPVKNIQRWVAVCGILLGLVVLACSALYVYGLQRKVEKLEEDNRTKSADIAASDTWRSGHVTYTKDKQEAKDETEAVLNRNREWADQPIPNDVADELRNRSDTKPSVP